MNESGEAQPAKRKQLHAWSSSAARLMAADIGCSDLKQAISSGVCSPDLHAFTPGAHVLPQEEVVQGDGPNDVEHLLDHLLDQFGVHAVLTHDRMEGVELPEDGVQCVGALISDAGGSFS